MGLTVYRVAKEIGVPQTRLWEIVKGKRGSRQTPTCASASSSG